MICGGDGMEKNVYLSVGNSLEVHLMKYSTPKKQAFFLLKYESKCFLIILIYLSERKKRFLHGIICD